MLIYSSQYYTGMIGASLDHVHAAQWYPYTVKSKVWMSQDDNLDGLLAACAL